MVLASSTPAQTNTLQHPPLHGVLNTAESLLAINAHLYPQPYKQGVIGASTGSSTPTIPASPSNKSLAPPPSPQKAGVYEPTMLSTSHLQAQVSYLPMHLQLAAQVQVQVRAQAAAEPQRALRRPPVREAAELERPSRIMGSVVGPDIQVQRL